MVLLLCGAAITAPTPDSALGQAAAEDDADDLLSRADHAMFAIKRARRSARAVA
ncbi:hypothetical protein [Actinoplanes subtropicus]|uniref:hypothetical protein n=1 Tax=Actinoplanes subtropicus TaxID=543632 RepID=UPI000AC0F51F|nr:hypothetical protein [Actinoplanes subtropicus]